MVTNKLAIQNEIQRKQRSNPYKFLLTLGLVLNCSVPAHSTRISKVGRFSSLIERLSTGSNELKDERVDLVHSITRSLKCKKPFLNFKYSKSKGNIQNHSWCRSKQEEPINMNTLLAQGSVFFKDSKKTVIFSSLIVFTLVLEEIFENVVFQCPCKNHLTYGLLFLIGPSLILFVAGILLNPNTWWICNIKRIKHQHKYVDQNCPCSKSKQRFCRAVGLIVDIFFKALISPTIWLILSFLRKTFFVCSAFGPRLKNRNLENNVKNMTGCGNLKPRSVSEQAELMAKSQTIGLVILMSTTLIIFCAFIGKRLGYRSKVSLPNENFYKRVETIEAVKEFNKRAKQEAQKQGKRTVDQAFEEIAKDYQGNYLLRIAKVAERLDQKYSTYYDSSAQIIEEKQRKCEEGNQKGNSYVAHCRFEEDINRNTFLMVDGKINTSGCEAKIRATIESSEKEATTRAPSGITRVSLYRRAKSVK